MLDHNDLHHTYPYRTLISFDFDRGLMEHYVEERSSFNVTAVELCSFLLGRCEVSQMLHWCVFHCDRCCT